MENLENIEQQKLKVEKIDDGDIFFISGLDEDSLFQLGFLICQNLDKSINQYLFKKDYFLSGESIRPGGCFALTYDKYKKRIFLDNRNARGDEKIREKIKEQQNSTTTTSNTTTTTKIRFIKDPNSKTVYTADVNKKITPIANEKIFRSIANIPETKPINWNIVEKPNVKEFKTYIKEEIKPVSIDNVKTEVKIKFIKDPNSSTVYTVDEGNKISPVLNENNFRIFTNTPTDKPIDWSVVEKPSLKEFESYSK